jgi:glycosyltransferase involved in cell wall biosynthesis
VIVGINYDPEVSGIAPYTTAVAEHLAKKRWEVLVITGIPHYPTWRVSGGYRTRVTTAEKSNGVGIRRLRHYVPSTQHVHKRALYEISFGAHVLTQRLPWRPDVVLAIVPSLLGAAAACRLAQRHSVPLSLWLQDLMGKAAAQSGMAGGSFAANIVTEVERRLLRQAKSIAVISDAFQAHVEAMGIEPHRIIQIPNWTQISPPNGDRARMRCERGWTDDLTVVMHSGNMGLKQDLDNVVEAARLAELQASKVRFVLMGEGSQRNRLVELGKGMSTLEIIPPIASDRYADTLAAADLLLVNERPGVLDMSLPSKLTSYMLAGRPIVAAVDKAGSTARQIRVSGSGILVEPANPQALLQAVTALALDTRTAAALAAHGPAYAAKRLSPGVAMTRVEALLRLALQGWGRRQWRPLSGSASYNHATQRVDDRGETVGDHSGSV